MNKSGDYVRQIDPAGFSRKRDFWQTVHLDPLLLMLLLVLTGAGLFVLYSASDFSFVTLKRQSFFFIIAYGLMVFIAQLPMHFYRRSAPAFYILGVFLLVLVPIFGTGAKGAQRWLELPWGLPRFQPAELLKIVMPVAIAWYLSRRVMPPNIKYIFAVLFIIMVPTLLIAVQPDLGTAILIAVSGIFVLLLAGLSWWYVVGAVLFVMVSAYPMWHYVLHDYQKGRILTLLDPERDKFGAGWNIMQSKTAIGSGGLEGKGWLEGTQSHLNFLPESHTDFIIAVLAEEFGLIGIVSLLVLYFAIICRGVQIAFTAQNSFNQLVAGSITLTFFVYIFVNMGMVSGLLPVVGVPLPLVSQGGTSIVTLMVGFGLLMAIATDKQQFAR